VGERWLLLSDEQQQEYERMAAEDAERAEMAPQLAAEAAVRRATRDLSSSFAPLPSARSV
jgi:hypothetical protein